MRGDARVWDIIQDQLGALLPQALGVIPEALARPELDGGFGLDVGELLTFAAGQYQSRLGRLHSARDGVEAEVGEEVAPA